MHAFPAQARAQEHAAGLRLVDGPSAPYIGKEFGSAVRATNFHLVAVVAWWLTVGLHIDWSISLSLEVHMVALVEIGLGMLAALWGLKG